MEDIGRRIRGWRRKPVAKERIESSCYRNQAIPKLFREKRRVRMEQAQDVVDREVDGGQGAGLARGIIAVEIRLRGLDELVAKFAPNEIVRSACATSLNR